MYADIAAITFAVLIGIVILFQIGLLAGMPWGSYAMGGKYPPAMRAACLVQIAVPAMPALIVLSRAGWLLPGWRSFAPAGIWPVVGFSAIAAVLNLITRSGREALLWTPGSMLPLIASLAVAIG